MFEVAVFWKLLFMEEDISPFFWIALCPKRSKSTNMFYLDDPPPWVLPPDSIVCFIDLSGKVDSPPYLIVDDWTFLDSLRNACVFLDLSLILLSSSAFSPLLRASIVIIP
jgi:hypothetical protein